MITKNFVTEAITDLYPELMATNQVRVMQWSSGIITVTVLGSLHVHGSTHYYGVNENALEVFNRIKHNYEGWEVK